mgnify:FL=1
MYIALMLLETSGSGEWFTNGVQVRVGAGESSDPLVSSAVQ